MATTAVHFLTIVGPSAVEAQAGIDALIACRRRAVVDEPEEFEDVQDPLLGGSIRDEPVINHYCDKLLETVHRLPTLYYSQFVHNFTGPRRMLYMLPPPSDRPCRVLGYNYDIAYYAADRADQTLAAIQTARRLLTDRDIEGRAFLDHLEVALTSARWVKQFTVVVIEGCIYATREDYEINDPNLKLGVPPPVYFALRPKAEDDTDALVDLWQHALRAAKPALPESEIVASAMVLRENVLENAIVTVMTADDAEVIGFCATQQDRIRAIAVAPAYQRRGGGQLLLRQLWKEHGVLYVNVHEQNLAARAFFQWFGFKVTGQSNADQPDGAVLRMRVSSHG